MHSRDPSNTIKSRRFILIINGLPTSSPFFIRQRASLSEISLSSLDSKRHLLRRGIIIALAACMFHIIIYIRRYYRAWQYRCLLQDTSDDSYEVLLTRVALGELWDSEKTSRIRQFLTVIIHRIPDSSVVVDSCFVY